MAKTIGDVVKTVEPILAANNECCTYGYIGEKHEDHKRNQICHARLRSGVGNTDFKYYYTSLIGYQRVPSQMKTFDISKEQMTNYGQFLLGVNSPFKSFLKDRERELVFNNEGMATGFVIESSPDDDLDNLFALSVAGRYTNEKLPGYGLMLRLIAEGVRPSEAWYICHFFAFSDQTLKIFKPQYYSCGHTNFDGYQIDINRLAEGKPIEGTVKAKHDGTRHPTCTARFWLKGVMSGNWRETFDTKVEESSDLNGRWSRSKGVVDIKAILKGWEKYRDELSKLAA